MLIDLKRIRGTGTAEEMLVESARRAGWSRLLRELSHYALGLLIITLPWRQRILLVERPSPPVYRDLTDLLLYTHDIFLLLLLLIWGGSLALKPRSLSTGPIFIWASLLGLTGAAAISVIGSVDPILAAYRTLYLLFLLLLYLYTVNEITHFRPILWAVAIQISMQAFIGITQVWRQADLGMAWLSERSLDPGAGSAIVWAEDGLHSLRAYGLADHPNILGFNLVIGMLILGTWYLATSSWWRVPTSLLISLGAVALLLTFARPAWTALVLGGLTAVAVILEKRPRPIWRKWIMLAIVILLALSPFIWRYLPYLSMGTGEATISSRVHERLDVQAERRALNNAANQLFIDRAITGVGMSTLPLAMRGYVADFGYDYQPARVTMLNVAAETGLFGAMFYFILLTGPWIAMRLNRDRLRFSPALIGLSALLMTVTIFNLFDAYTWVYPSGQLWQWLIWGFWAIAYQAATRESSGESYA